MFDLLKVLGSDGVRLGLRADSLGEIKDLRVKEGVEMMQTPAELRNFVRGIAVKRGICRKHGGKFGALRVAIQLNEKLNVVTVPVEDDEMIIITTEPNVSIAAIGEIVSKLTDAKLVLQIK